MTNNQVDIVVPVWNRPAETRNCLVSLIEHTPRCRLILVNNSSDRETERMLQEFAEALEVQILLLHNEVNEGFVKAVNRGLARSESRFVAVVRHNSVVKANWLEPLMSLALKEPDVGMIVPRFVDEQAKKHTSGKGDMEISYGDFAALLLRRELLEQIGFFDEDMDGGLWCLKQYSRCAYKAGFRTCKVDESEVARAESVRLGNALRLAELERRIKDDFVKMWGVERSFCLNIPKGTGIADFGAIFPLIPAALRQGHRLALLAHASFVKDMIRSGFNIRHSNFEIITIPRFMPFKGVRRAFAGLDFKPTLVAWRGETSFPGEELAIPFEEFESIIRKTEEEVYGRKIGTDTGGEAPNEERD